MNNPFSLDNERSYRLWRDAKLAAYPQRVEDILVDIDTLRDLSLAEKHRCLQLIRQTNMALLRSRDISNIDKDALQRLGGQFGLHRLDHNLRADTDSVSTITVAERGGGNEYIPYTNRPLSWHTDGYYNRPEQRVRAWALLCARDAVKGGENALLDHEILYILLRDENPEYIRALSSPGVMTLPANLEDGVEIRPARSNPVFSVDPADGSLHMAYSARGRNIVWRQDAATRDALAFMQSLFSEGSTYIFRHRLAPGECLLSNNVLHNRSAFRDTPEHKRVIYRARYYDRIDVQLSTGGTNHAETE